MNSRDQRSDLDHEHALSGVLVVPPARGVLAAAGRRGVIPSQRLSGVLTAKAILAPALPAAPVPGIAILWIEATISMVPSNVAAPVPRFMVKSRLMPPVVMDAYMTPSS